METLFWTLTAFIFYTYAGYPLLIASRAFLRPHRVQNGANTPFLSIVIAAYNEELGIRRRLNNLLSQDYPAECYQIIVVSDGSTDGTNLILDSYSSSKVISISLQERSGKAAALNRGVARAEGEIIVFADARQRFADDALTLLVSNFTDPAVGCVSGELILVDESGSDVAVEMGAYWRYEKWIRNLESKSGSVVGATGAIYAIRKKLYVPLPTGTILDDVLTPMNVARQGYRVIFDGAPRAYDQVSKCVEQEWTRKVRTLAGNMQLLQISPSLVLPGLSPLWWRFLSHKIFRLFIPFALIGLLASTFFCHGVLYRFALCAQLFLYLIALAGHLLPSLRRVRFVGLANFFIIMNLAALAGVWLWVSGRCATTWRPADLK
jgi:biofilm PGA synthesis N-glycosyltransferase PgaC